MPNRSEPLSQPSRASLSGFVRVFRLGPGWFPVLWALGALLVGLASCRPQRVAERGPMFVPPTAPPSATPSPTPPFPVGPTASTPEPQVTACVNDLRFVRDETIPDNSVVSPGQVLDKGWRVKNSGTCAWGAGYTLRFVRGMPMGAESPQPLFPAKPGAEVVLRVRFVAPEEPGIYSSLWQAFDPQGQPFGEPVYILVQVVAPSPTPSPSAEP